MSVLVSVMLFWLSSTDIPALVVNVGAGVCSLAIFINWLELISSDSIGVRPVGLISLQPDLMRCQAAQAYAVTTFFLATRPNGWTQNKLGL